MSRTPEPVVVHVIFSGSFTDIQIEALFGFSNQIEIARHSCVADKSAQSGQGCVGLRFDGDQVHFKKTRDHFVDNRVKVLAIQHVGRMNHPVHKDKVTADIGGKAPDPLDTRHFSRIAALPFGPRSRIDRIDFMFALCWNHQVVDHILDHLFNFGILTIDIQLAQSAQVPAVSRQLLFIALREIVLTEIT